MLEKYSVALFLFCETGSYRVDHSLVLASWVLRLQARTIILSLILLSTVSQLLYFPKRLCVLQFLAPFVKTWSHWKTLPVTTTLLFAVLQNNHESRESTREFLPGILCSSSLTFLKSAYLVIHFGNTIGSSILKGLQAHGVHLSRCLFQSQEELQEYCRHHEITYVALVSDKEGSHVKVKIVGELEMCLRGQILALPRWDPWFSSRKTLLPRICETTGKSASISRKVCCLGVPVCAWACSPFFLALNSR